MASGDTLCVFTARDAVLPSSAFAQPDTRNNHAVVDFDAATDESVFFEGILPRNYAGGGITVTVVWAGTSATSGDVVWFTQFERVDTGTDIDADSFDATGVSGTGTASGTSGAPTYTANAHSNGARLDSLAVGEAFRLKVTRDADNGSDTMTGDAELIAVEMKET